MALSLTFVSCDKDNDIEKTEGTTGGTKGSVIIYNKYSKSTYSGSNGDIQRISISNNDFFQTYYYDIKKGENKTISNIPEGTYSVSAQVKTTSLYRNETRNGIKVKKGQNTSVTFQ